MNVLNISLPFSYYRKVDENISMEYPNDEIINSYLKALDVETNVEPSEEPIDVIRYIGDLSPLPLKTFERLHGMILKRFKTDNLKETTVSIFPGVLSLAYMTTFKTLKISNIVIDCPTFVDEEMKTYGLPNTHSAMDQTIYMFENFQMTNYGLRTYRGIPNRDKERYLTIAKEIIRVNPKFVVFEVFEKNCDDSNFEVLREKLLQVGYKNSGNYFYKDELPLYLKESFTSTYGYGLGASTVSDGVYTKTTNDRNLYCRSSAYFDEIVEVVRNVEI